MKVLLPLLTVGVSAADQDGFISALGVFKNVTSSDGDLVENVVHLHRHLSEVVKVGHVKSMPALVQSAAHSLDKGLVSKLATHKSVQKLYHAGSTIFGFGREMFENIKQTVHQDPIPAGADQDLAPLYGWLSTRSGDKLAAYPSGFVFGTEIEYVVDFPLTPDLSYSWALVKCMPKMGCRNQNGGSPSGGPWVNQNAMKICLSPAIGIAPHWTRAGFRPEFPEFNPVAVDFGVTVWEMSSGNWWEVGLGHETRYVTRTNMFQDVFDALMKVGNKITNRNKVLPTNENVGDQGNENDQTPQTAAGEEALTGGGWVSPIVQTKLGLEKRQICQAFFEENLRNGEEGYTPDTFYVKVLECTLGKKNVEKRIDELCPDCDSNIQLGEIFVGFGFNGLVPDQMTDVAISLSTPYTAWIAPVQKANRNRQTKIEAAKEKKREEEFEKMVKFLDAGLGGHKEPEYDDSTNFAAASEAKQGDMEAAEKNWETIQNFAKCMASNGQSGATDAAIEHGQMLLEQMKENITLLERDNMLPSEKKEFVENFDSDYKRLKLEFILVSVRALGQEPEKDTPCETWLKDAKTVVGGEKQDELFGQTRQQAELLMETEDKIRNWEFELAVSTPSAISGLTSGYAWCYPINNEGQITVVNYPEPMNEQTLIFEH